MADGEPIGEVVAPLDAVSRPQASTGRYASWVAAGILLSRIMGLLRQRVFAHHFGSSMAAAAFSAALRIPNFLQNLFGEGALSASFIPVYAQLLGKGEREAADRVASAVFGMLSLLTSALVALGVAFAGPFTDLVAPGLEPATRTLTVQLVRILFPGTGLLVVSAWCLGILNSHRRFFLSYAAPVVWNLAIIATLVAFGGRGDLERLAEIVAWGTVAGSFLQLAVQWPQAFRLLDRFRPALGLHLPEMRQVVKGFLPAVVGRGVVQVSAFVDLAYASLVTDRAIAVLSFAQNVSLLPVSLFGIAVSAAELPVMSQASGTPEEVAQKLRERVRQGLSRIAFFVVPSAAGFLFLGDVVAGALFQTGRFTAADTRFAWYLLMGSAVGLLASSRGRLYASAFYAMKDTRTPLFFAVFRVVAGAALALYAVRVLPFQLGIPAELGAAGITLASGVAAWLECQLLRRQLARRIGDARLGAPRWAALYSAAGAASLAALAVKWGLLRAFGAEPGTMEQWGGQWLPAPRFDAVATAVLVLGAFGFVYLAVAYALKVEESAALFRKVLRRQR